MKKFIVSIFLIYIFSATYAQPNLLYQGKILSTDYIDTASVEFLKNKIVVPVQIRGKVRRFILDTGAPLLITKELQAELHFPTLKKELLADINLRLDSTDYVQIPQLSIGKVDFQNVTALVADLNTGLLSCFGIDGIIGSNLLVNSILLINLERKQIVLTDKIGKLGLPSDKALDLVLETQQSTPIIEISPFPKANEQIFVDTGDDGFYSMSLRSFAFFVEKTSIKKYLISQSKGASTVGLHGLEQDTTKHLLVLDSLKIGSLYFSNVNVATQTNPNSRIGAEILKYGSMTIDYLNKKFYFLPFEGISKENRIQFQPKNSANLGFALKNEGNLLKVASVWEGTGVAEQGIKIDFVIKKIDEYEVLGKSICELLFDLDTLFEGKREVSITFIDLEGKEKKVLKSLDF
jgi:hypothetical protein